MRAWVDLDDNRDGAAIAISFGGARKGCDVGGPDREPARSIAIVTVAL